MPKEKEELISAYQFAERKEVSNVAVYYRINTTKEIETVAVGKRKYIDWNKYQHFEFPIADRQKKAGKHPSVNLDWKAS